MVRGYTLANDVTARDLQKKDGQWTRAKGFDTFCPVGPWVSDEIDPAAGITIETRVNGESRQHGSTEDLSSPFRVAGVHYRRDHSGAWRSGAHRDASGVGPLAAGDG